MGAKPYFRRDGALACLAQVAAKSGQACSLLAGGLRMRLPQKLKIVPAVNHSG
jgi:hypothetical protein